MIIDFDRVVAYRCDNCGEITYGFFSLFELSGSKGISIECNCGKSSLQLISDGNFSYDIILNCIVCNDSHRFTLPYNSLAKKEVNEFLCPSVPIGIAFVGKEKAVKKAVSENDAYLDEVITACGLEHTGKNGIVMLKALDKIQQLSEDGCLTCKCGSNLINIEIYENDIMLECCLCGATMRLPAELIKKKEFSELRSLTLIDDKNKK